MEKCGNIINDFPIMINGTTTEEETKRLKLMIHIWSIMTQGREEERKIN
jgi:hypothetical protein